MGDRAREIRCPLPNDSKESGQWSGPLALLEGPVNMSPSGDGAGNPPSSLARCSCRIVAISLRSPAFMGTSVRKITIFKSLQCKVLH